MLTELTLHHLALAERLQIELAPGLSVITGETGAGKSLLLTGLGLCLGDRADATQIRAPHERAEVSACFDVSALPEVRAWLQEQEIECDGELVLRRVLHADGRSRALVNGRPVPLADLRQITPWLMDIHSQHEHHLLLRKEQQRLMLDNFAQQGELVARLARHYRLWQEAEVSLQGAHQTQQKLAERAFFIRHQLAELEQLAPRRDEVAAIESEYDRLAHVDSRREHLSAALLLLDDEEGQGLLPQLTQLRQRLQQIGDEPDLLDFGQQARLQLDELRRSLSAQLDQLEADPARLQWLDERLAQLHRQARRHGCEPTELADVQERLQSELADIEAGLDLAQLQARAEQARQDYDRDATTLSQARQAAASTFAAAICAHLPALGMPHAQLQFELRPLAAAASYGLEDVELLFCANPGQALRPLAKVASGGELSRISLAIQVVYAAHSQVPTLVFDEVDVGVSGRVADAVGRLLRQLGAHAQILCVTHQPQVAAQGHQHLRVEKQYSAAGTETQVRLLQHEERVEELARLSGGAHISRETLQHARALLEQTIEVLSPS